MKKLVVMVLAVILIFGMTACGNNRGKEEPTPTKQIEETEEEKKLQKEDEAIAEEFRHTVEIAAAVIEVYDEIAGIIGSSSAEVEIVSWGPNGIEYVKEMPNLKTAIEDVYKNVSKVAFTSEKYKGMKYVVTFKKDGALTAIGTWR